MSIDFLNHVLGTKPTEIRKHAVDIMVPIRSMGHGGELPVPVMHPLHVLQSRVANVVRLEPAAGRTDDPSARTRVRQANAAPIILREYVKERLNQGIHREAAGTLRQLAVWLGSDEIGRQAHKIVKDDPLEILASLGQDQRFDARWRELTLTLLVAGLRRRRQAGKQAAIVAAMAGRGRG